MDLGIDGRRAAIAAGTAGLGYATAAALAAEGVGVAVCGRDTDRMTAAVEALAKVATGQQPAGFEADMSQPGEPEDFAAAASDALGGALDIVVCNAGGPPPGTALGTDLDAYRTALELNCLSTIALCRATVPTMVENGWGRVVAITSIGARQPIGTLAASSTARAAVTSFLKVLSGEVSGGGVTVNSLQPGLHRTDRMRQLAEGRGGRSGGDGLPADLGDPADFGAVAAFLCSQQAGFVTGVGLHVDGGAYRGLQ